MHSKLVIKYSILLTILILLAIPITAEAQSTAFTYQGRLTDGGSPANGNYDLQFTLWDALSGGTQQPQPSPVTVTKTSVVVANGVFTVSLDFSANAFPGADRYLEIGVRLTGAQGITILAPRQQITSTPYAVRTQSAATADNATTASMAANANQLGGVAANQYVITTDSRLSDSRTPTAGSSNYIQNGTTQQASSNFNISGNGVVGGNLVTNGTVGIGTANPPLPVTVINSAPPGVIGAYSSGAGPGIVLNPNITSGIVSIYSDTLGAPGTEPKLHLSTYSNKGSAQGITIDTSGNVGIGTTSPIQRLHILGNALFATSGTNGVRITPSSDLDIGILNVTNAANTKNWLTVGPDGRIVMDGPSASDPNPTLTVGGAVMLHGGALLADYVNAGGSSVPACWLTGFSGAPYFLGQCSSSSLRYKTNIATFHGGMDVINLLRPISFKWKQDGARDVGFGAEDVERVAPLFTFRNNKGEIEGVRYDRLSVLFVNAFKEQQAQIENQQEQLKRQQEQIKRQEEQARQQRAAFALQQQQLDALKQLVCRSHRRATLCR